MNDNYKKHHKPLNEEKSKFHQGYYVPKNPQKCLTAQNIYRSGWEAKFFRWCDDCPNVLRWASEPIPVKYKNPIANMKYCLANGLNPQDPRNWKELNYYTDVWIELQGQTGNIRKIFIEIKPYSQTQPPKPINEGAKLKEYKAYNRAAETFLVNKAKWEAAEKYFTERGAEFMVLTERGMKKMGILGNE